MPFLTPFDSTLAPLLTLLVALGLDVVLGELPWLYRFVPHPVVAIGNAIGTLDRKLNKPERGAADRRIRGVLTVVLIVAPLLVLGWLIEEVTSKVPFVWPIYLLLVVSLIAGRSLYEHVKAVKTGLDESLEAGRTAVSMIVGRSPDKLDRAGVSRAAIESLAENFSDGVVAPVFWFAVLGLPGLLAYKAINTMDSMIGYKNEKYAAFGWAAARLDDLVNLIPARLAGVLIGLGAGRTWGKALLTMTRDAGKHKSPNAGWPEAAMAGALGLKLAGPRHYPTMTVDDSWIGAGRDAATPIDIRRALRVYVRANIALAVLVGLALLIQQS